MFNYYITLSTYQLELKNLRKVQTNTTTTYYIEKDLSIILFC